MARKRTKHIRIYPKQYASLSMIAQHRRWTVQAVMDDAIAEYLANHALTSKQEGELLHRVLSAFNNQGK